MDYRKLFWAIAGVIAFGLQGALTDGGLSIEEGIVLGAAVLNALGTWLIPNTPVLATAKTWVNALVLGAGAVIPLLPDGITSQEVWTIVIAVGTAAGVFAMPGPKPDPLAARRGDDGSYDVSSLPRTT
jgi:hypothetical protein